MNIKEIFTEQINTIQNIFNRKLTEYNSFIEKIQKFEKYSNEYISNIEYLLKYFPESKDDK